MGCGSEPGLRTSDRLEGIVGEGGKEQQNHSGEAGKGAGQPHALETARDRVGQGGVQLRQGQAGMLKGRIERGLRPPRESHAKESGVPLRLLS